MYEEWNRLIHSDQNGTVAGVDVPNSSAHYPTVHPAESRQLRAARTYLCLELGNSYPADLLTQDAKMPACRWEDGGGVVAQCLAVMARTW